MRIGLQTWGSEGDIRPFVALGAALARRGHDVELLYTEIADRKYEAIARTLGFTARGVASPILTSVESQAKLGLQILNTRNQLAQGLIISKRLLEPVIDQLYDAGLGLCRRSDLVIHHFILHAARAGIEDLTVGEIAFRVGYGDQLYFSRAFKRRFGAAPMAYRAQARGKSMDT